jgi:hypothetical protein
MRGCFANSRCRSTDRIGTAVIMTGDPLNRRNHLSDKPTISHRKRARKLVDDLKAYVIHVKYASDESEGADQIHGETVIVAETGMKLPL